MILTAGKMPASGIISEAGEKILTEKDVEAFVDAGADVILLPAPWEQFRESQWNMRETYKKSA